MRPFCTASAAQVGLAEVDGADDSSESHGAVKAALDRASLRIVALAVAAMALALARIVWPDAWTTFASNVAVSVAVVFGMGAQLVVARGPGEAAKATTMNSPLFDASADDDGAEPLALQTGPPKRRTQRAGAVDSYPSQTVKTVELWLFLVAIFPAAGMGLMTLQNLGQIVSSRGGSPSMQKAATSFASIANCFGRLGCGKAADALVARGIPRPALMVAADLGGTLSMLLLYVTGTSVAGALAGSFCAGASYGMIWTMIPTLASDIWGSKTFGANYMLCLPAVILGSVCFSTYLAPTVYADNAGGDDDDDVVGCNGAACFADTYLIVAAACGVGSLSAMCLAKKTAPLYVFRDAPASDGSDP